MTHLVVAPIVEGQGEVAALPVLLRRIATELCDGSSIEVFKPIRQPASSLVKAADDCLRNAVELAAFKLSGNRHTTATKLILILIDADGRCAAQLGPELKRRAQEHASHLNIASVIAVDEFETWFVASAESLTKYLNINPTEEIPPNPEESRCKTKWIEDHFRGVQYNKPADQPKFCSAMDLTLCRSRAPSFDKLCREIVRMFSASPRLKDRVDGSPM